MPKKLGLSMATLLMEVMAEHTRNMETLLMEVMAERIRDMETLLMEVMVEHIQGTVTPYTVDRRNL
jgi:hypothetical protein